MVGDRVAKLQAISIHALCEEGDRRRWRPAAGSRISIHALCEEGDLPPHLQALRPGISIHALCEEGDMALSPMSRMYWIFLSTPSARRATLRG